MWTEPGNREGQLNSVDVSHTKQAIGALTLVYSSELSKAKTRIVKDRDR